MKKLVNNNLKTRKDMEIYCDNAATTALDPEVLNAMIPYLTNQYGNASSNHIFGRKAKEAVEESRLTVAKLFNVSPNDIFFTSGATEANNLAIAGAVRTFEVQHAITSRIEHKAVLQTLGQFSQEGELEVSFVQLDTKGNIDFEHLENLLKYNPQTLVSLMHVNNEIGNINDIRQIGYLVKKYDGLFHTDTTQSIGKYKFDISLLNVDYLVGSAHKFHGPKGVGFIYIDKYKRVKPHTYGGAQERGTRGGTENVAGIVGLAKALEVAYRGLEEYRNHIAYLKSYLIEQLKNSPIPDISFNGASESETASSYNIVNVAFPHLRKGGPLLDKLDKLDIAVSGGSACSNLTSAGSHVLKALQQNLDKDNIRFSFSKFNTPYEIKVIIDTIRAIYEEDRLPKNVTPLATPLLATA
ncbi:cysteine desulfurase family protein [Flectobacillus major]|uniref:cysteine desulfurase family protein n=1 Tax=Flectobacillus major TaxID=103 RepID=UPI000403DC19|nr:cysteine desulfurase family protein [Flectobacillus major]